MIFLPIDVDESRNQHFRENPECIPILDMYPSHYRKVGYAPPWIGYFLSFDGRDIIGGGGFKGAPKNGMVEIAYGTFTAHQRKGVGTQICRELVDLALRTDSSVRITARTLQCNFDSQAVLKKNGFECLGIIYDEEDGDVFEWELKKKVN